jgi:hypothetical protein
MYTVPWSSVLVPRRRIYSYTYMDHLSYSILNELRPGRVHVLTSRDPTRPPIDVEHPGGAVNRRNDVHLIPRPSSTQCTDTCSVSSLNLVGRAIFAAENGNRRNDVHLIPSSRTKRYVMSCQTTLCSACPDSPRAYVTGLPIIYI